MGAGGTLLSRLLNSTKSISIPNRTGVSYLSTDSLNDLSTIISSNKELKDYAPVHGDKIVYNKDFSCSELYKFCKFIYLVREPESCIRQIVVNHNYTLQGAYNYYKFRMRRLYELSRKTNNSLLVDYKDLISGEGFYELEKFLYLKNKIRTTYDLLSGDSSDENLAAGRILKVCSEPDLELPKSKINDVYLKYKDLITKSVRDLEFV